MMKASRKLADVGGGAEDTSQGEAAWKRVVADRCQRHRPHTTATRAIGIPTKLAWRDPGFQIGRDIKRSLGKDAFFG